MHKKEKFVDNPMAGFPRFVGMYNVQPPVTNPLIGVLSNDSLITANLTNLTLGKTLLVNISSYIFIWNGGDFTFDTIFLKPQLSATGGVVSSIAGVPVYLPNHNSNINFNFTITNTVGTSCTLSILNSSEYYQAGETIMTVYEIQ
jgi:hypothetical protein